MVMATSGRSNGHLWKEFGTSKRGTRRGIHFPDADFYYAGEIFLEDESNTSQETNDQPFYQNIVDNITTAINKCGKWPDYPKINFLTDANCITLEWQKIGKEEIHDYLKYGPSEWKKWSKSAIVSATTYLNSLEFQEFLQRTESVNHVLKSELFSVEFKQFVISNLT